MLEELKQREPIFHHPEFGTTRRDYENMTDLQFWEVGASGRRYSREFVLETLENRQPDPDESKWLTRDFQCREIAADNYLITYTLVQGPRVTRRQRCVADHGAVKARGSSTLMEICTLLALSTSLKRSTT